MISLIMTEGNSNTNWKERVREFILSVCRDTAAQWPERCNPTVVKDGEIKTIKGGPSYVWQETATELFLGNYNGAKPPDWVPGTLFALTHFFGLAEDEELHREIKDLLYRVQTRTAAPFQVGNVLAMKKIVTNKMATNPETGQVAVWFEKEGEETEGSWRLGDGERIEIKAPWIALQGT